MTTDTLLIGITAILVLGIVAQWLAWRFVVPSILVLLVFGFLAGPVFEILEPDAILGNLLFPIVSVSVAIILFEGGLTLRFAELSEIGKVVRNLVTVGAFVTWVAGSVAAYAVFGLDLRVAILFGAILVVSGPTVVMPLLRHVNPNRRVGSILKWEGIVIDPIGALLALLVFEAIVAGGIIEGTFVTLGGLVMTILIGTGIGIGAALLLILFLMRYWVPDFLQNPVSLMMVVAAFGISNTLQHESGLFAVTVMGIALANQKTVDMKHILEFKENLRVLLISSIFIILAARLDLADVTGYLNINTLIFLGLLLFVIRPLGVAVSSFRSKLNWRERVFLAWMAPRGIVAAAVSAIFGIYLAQRNVPDAGELAPLTFIVIVGTVTIYGLTAAPIARLLGVAKPSSQGVLIVGGHVWGRAIAKMLQNAGLRVLVVDTNRTNIITAREEGLSASQGSVLSEYILDKIELEGIGRMLAMTSNDEVNSLATIYFSERFGRSEVYQLPPSDRSQTRRRTVPKNLRGRVLFTPETTYEYFESVFEQGGVIEQAEITQSFSFDRFMAENANSVVPLFIVGPGTELVVFAENNLPAPVPGQKVIFLRERTEGTTTEVGTRPDDIEQESDAVER